MSELRLTAENLPVFLYDIEIDGDDVGAPAMICKGCDETVCNAETGDSLHVLIACALDHHNICVARERTS